MDEHDRASKNVLSEKTHAGEWWVSRNTRDYILTFAADVDGRPGELGLEEVGRQAEHQKAEEDPGESCHPRRHFSVALGSRKLRRAAGLLALPSPPLQSVRPSSQYHCRARAAISNEQPSRGTFQLTSSSSLAGRYPPTWACKHTEKGSPCEYI